MSAQLALLADSAPAPKAKRVRRIHPSVPDVPATTVPAALLRAADWILLNSSGGKDSQAMASHVRDLAAKLGLLHRVVIVHADLGDIEGEDTRKLAEEQARRLGERFEVVKAEGGDLLAHAVARFFKLKAKAEKEAREEGRDPATAKAAPAWPSSAARWCTSDLKRGPIRKLMTRPVAESAGLGRPVRILNCMGQRAAESAPRAKRLWAMLHRLHQRLRCEVPGQYRFRWQLASNGPSKGWLVVGSDLRDLCRWCTPRIGGAASASRGRCG
ncbi:adenine nucleotide alpha hydrolase family protein [Streptomyces halobius]|uniref:Phosphoadenosine phosphosulfate reductase family protein n=1 Tax=Streptomyces halobius TaxID=2879846 RepID=A0ABY4MH75_9ACTN|nr:hypothetical protein [Streptomyces halobius]UQA96712.1 hypothetical protein K9S39_36910 [Streptomyces halobius]